MITIQNTRFGTVEVAESEVLRFENGLVGFPEQTQFVLLERADRKMVAYLQSVVTPELAFPIIDGGDISGYPNPTAEQLAQGAGLATDDVALLVIVAANSSTKTLEANLLAPIVVDMNTRRCAQVVLDARKYSAAEPLAPPKRDPVAEAKARIAELRNKRAQESTEARHGVAS